MTYWVDAAPGNTRHLNGNVTTRTGVLFARVNWSWNG